MASVLASILTWLVGWLLVTLLLWPFLIRRLRWLTPTSSTPAPAPVRQVRFRVVNTDGSVIAGPFNPDHLGMILRYGGAGIYPPHDDDGWVDLRALLGLGHPYLGTIDDIKLQMRVERLDS